MELRQPAEVALGPLLVFCPRDYPEYWNIVTGWLREHRQRPAIAGEHDGVNSLLAAVESGLGVAIVTTCTARLMIVASLRVRQQVGESSALKVSAPTGQIKLTQRHEPRGAVLRYTP